MCDLDHFSVKARAAVLDDAGDFMLLLLCMCEYSSNRKDANHSCLEDAKMNKENETGHFHAVTFMQPSSMKQLHGSTAVLPG